MLADCPSVRHVVGLESDETIQIACVPWPDVDAEAHDDPPDVSVVELDPAYILHTSGSTGQPKLILHTHQSAMSRSASSLRCE